MKYPLDLNPTPGGFLVCLWSCLMVSLSGLVGLSFERCGLASRVVGSWKLLGNSKMGQPVFIARPS